VWEELAPRLEGRLVVLEPLSEVHFDGLLAAGSDPEVWRWLGGFSETPERFRRWFDEALAESGAGREAAFATIDRRSGEPIGSSRYLALRPEHRGLEIGWTWLAPRAWGTGANVEAKLLMLGHAFDRLGCMRVEFKTDARNQRSRLALEALPAHFEGVFRRHMALPGGDVRDSAYYSVIDSEWPEVRAALEHRLAAVTGQA
jgi:RimJ/RimL family protein N-acetyltransferase